jgi:hypothetical protein
MQLIHSLIFLRRHKIPPRNLISLAQRYHNNVTIQPLMAESSSIALLQPPPSWGLASHADSDWVIRQRLHKEQGTKLNRHQRKNRKKLGNGSDCIIDDNSPFMSTNYSEKGDQPPLHAVIASGSGPDGLAEARKMRKKRKILVRSVVVIIFSVVALLGKSYFFSTPIQYQLPIKKHLLGEEEFLSLADCSLDARRQDKKSPTVSSDDKAIPSEDLQHTETIQSNQKSEFQLKNKSLPTGNEKEDVPTKSSIVENEGSDSDTYQHPVKSTSITVVSPSPSKQFALAFGQIKAAVEDEISFDTKGSARSAEAAQEIWRRQANNIKLQGERLLNFSKECLARGRH